MTMAIAAWAVTYLIHSSILIAASLIAARAIRSHSIREVLLQTALIGAVITSTLQLALPARKVVVVMQPAPIVSVSQTPAAPPPVKSTEAPPVRRSWSLSWQTVLIGTWFIASTLLLLRLALRRRLLQETLGSRADASAEDIALLETLKSRAGCRDHVRLTRSEGLRSPIAMYGREICLPPSFPTLTLEQREAVLAHELAHLMRSDPMWLGACELMQAVFFFQPLIHVVRRELRAAAEFLCDDFAVAHTGNRKAMAESLAEIASTLGDADAVPAMAMAETSSRFIERVKSVLRSDREPETTMRWQRRTGIMVGSLAALALLAPGAAPLIGAPKGVRRATVTSSSTINVDADRMDLSRTADDGTNTKIHAESVQIFDHRPFVRFTSRGGNFTLTHTDAHRTRYEVQAVPGADREPLFTYRVNGEERAWGEEAERLLRNAVENLGDAPAVPPTPPSPASLPAPPSPPARVLPAVPAVPAVPPSPRSAGGKWTGTLSYRQTIDDQTSRHIEIDATDVIFDDDGLSIERILPGGSITINEEKDGRSRGVTMRPGSRGDAVETSWSGDWTRDDSEDDRETWLREMFRVVLDGRRQH